MSKISLAAQLYSVRNDCATDLPSVLKRLSAIGYEGVEFAGFYGHDAVQVRQWLDDFGLQCAGSHTSLALLADDTFDDTVATNKIIGNRFVVVPGLPKECTESLDAWKRTAVRFNDLAERLETHGMRLGYHNHFIEFTPIDGTYPWDVFFSNTRNVIMQVDTGNARHAGVNAAPFIERYPGRAITVHLKEWTDDPTGAVVGEGKVDWNQVFTLCETVGGTEWYIVEQETYPYPPLESMEKCFVNIRRMLEQRKG
ncbi:MAG: TIM barrel protein [Kiritimatiellae bacterium]|nr:TIM barrel protein [Kiritimatiellia bacterium]